CPMHFALLSTRSVLPSATALQNGHTALPCLIVPLSGSKSICFSSTTSKRHCLALASGIRRIATLPWGLLRSHSWRTSGTVAPQAGFGHVMVLAHKYAVGTLPSSSVG